jgi:hypothetical protein
MVATIRLLFQKTPIAKWPHGVLHGFQIRACLFPRRGVSGGRRQIAALGATLCRVAPALRHGLVEMSEKSRNGPERWRPCTHLNLSSG